MDIFHCHKHCCKKSCNTCSTFKCRTKQDNPIDTIASSSETGVVHRIVHPNECSFGYAVSCSFIFKYSFGDTSAAN